MCTNAALGLIKIFAAANTQAGRARQMVINATIAPICPKNNCFVSRDVFSESCRMKMNSSLLSMYLTAE